jgi:ABC-type antimicrobial peptide transport system permease subunit
MKISVVRGRQPADQLAAAVRQAIWQYNPNAIIARVKTLDSQVADSLTTERLQTSILVAFGIAALLLAMLGIYGVLNYSVAGRTQEIAIRMALGASRKETYALILGEAGLPVMAGLVAGLTGGFLAARTVQKLLYGVQALDAPVSAGVAILFLVTALAAAFIPARRAASVDPMEALRTE